MWDNITSGKDRIGKFFLFYLLCTYHTNKVFPFKTFRFCFNLVDFLKIVKKQFKAMRLIQVAQPGVIIHAFFLVDSWFHMGFFLSCIFSIFCECKKGCLVQQWIMMYNTQIMMKLGWDLLLHLPLWHTCQHIFPWFALAQPFHRLSTLLHKFQILWMKSCQEARFDK